MRGKLQDQDLTDFALNEVEARHRAYVEQMCAVSVECRNDIYEMVEMAQMLEDGFERDSGRGPVLLLPEQRAALLEVARPSSSLSFLRQAAASLSLAACVAFALVQGQTVLGERGEGQTIAASAEAFRKAVEPAKLAVTHAVSSRGGMVDLPTFESLREMAEDSPGWWQIAAEVLPPPTVVCTPPTWLEGAELVELR